MKFINSIKNYLFDFKEIDRENYSKKHIYDVKSSRNQLIKNKRLNFIKDLISSFTLKKLDSINTFQSKFFTNINNETLEISIRQYLLLNLIGSRFNKSFYVSFLKKKPISAALPIEWIEILNSKKLKVSKIKSYVLLYFFMFKQLLAVFVPFFKTLLKSINFLINSKAKEKHVSSVYLFNLIPDTVPNSKHNKFNIFNWYISEFKEDDSIREIRHSLKNTNFKYKGHNCIYKDPIPLINSFINIFYFSLYFFYTLLVSLVFALFGNPYYAIFLKEFLKEKNFKLSFENSFSKELLFNNEQMVYRPFWTYFAEKKGIKIYLYNWSCGFSDLKNKDGYSLNDIGEEIQTWQYILQWSDLYLNYMNSIVISKQVIFKLCKPVFYIDSNIEFKAPNKKHIVLFDVIPLRDCFHDLLPVNIEYRTFINGRKFLNDVYDLSVKYGFTIVWKTKRKFGFGHSKAYIRFTKRFSNRPNVIKAEPETSAFKIIKSATASISMPFTSTGQVAQINNINSIYYDPTKILFKDDRGRQNCELISGKNELDLWFQTL